MKLPAAIRTTGTTLAFLACASLAIAGGGMSTDEGARAHALAAPARVNAPPATAQASACDNAPGCPRGGLRGAPVGPRTAVAPAMRVDEAPAAPGAPRVPAGDHRADKGEHGRPVPSTALHVHRPATQRSKGSLRNAPATPGMGVLLRMGTGAGRELSLLLDDVSCAPSSMRSGRAPPRGASHPTQARDPIACAAALAPPSATPEAVLPGVTHPTHNTFAPRSAAHPQGWKSAPVPLAAARRTGSSAVLTPERVACSPAERQKGATA